MRGAVGIEKLEGRRWGRTDEGSINEGGVVGGNIRQWALPQGFAINWFERTQMFAFCLRPMFTSAHSLLLLTVHNRYGGAPARFI